MNIELDPNLFCPLYWHLMEAANNPDIRYVFLVGGSSSGKSHATAQALTNKSLFDGDSSLIMKKEAVDLDDSIYSDFKGWGEALNGLTKSFTFVKHRIDIAKAKLRFRGLDNAERIKGVSKFKRIYWDEMTAFYYPDFKQIRKRMRGVKGQQFWGSWNPIGSNHWIKTEVLDREEWTDLPTELPGNKYSRLYTKGSVKENSYKRINATGDMLLIKTTHRDNYWVVGNPFNKSYGYYDKHTLKDYARDKIYNPVDYDIYCNGEWGILSDRLIFKHWSVIDKVPDGVKLKSYGIDFGFNPDPTAMVAVYIEAATKEDARPKMYIDEVIYEQDLVNIDTGDELKPSVEKRLKEFEGFDMSKPICSENEGKSIAELRLKGFNIYKARKGPGSISAGIKRMKTYDIYITKRSKNIIKEYENYQHRVDKNDNILPEPIDDFNHCFHADTLILCDNTLKKIKDVKVGDYVNTSKGLRLVEKSFVNGYREIFDITLNFGIFELNIKATDNHKIKTNEGWVEFNKLKTGQMVFLSNYLMEKFIESIKVKGIILEVGKNFIELFGNIIMERSVKKIISIIKMKIQIIIILITLRVRIKLNILESIALKGLRTIPNGSRIFILKGSKKLKIGTNQKKEKNGTDNMLRTLDLEHTNSTIKNATYAKNNSLPKSMVKDFVQTHVNQHIGGSKDTTMLLEFASFVMVNSQQINTQRKRHVQGLVLQNIELKKAGSDFVYDLTIEDQHEFFAGGILSHNCIDATRYMLSMRDMLWR